ncbi:MAG TPA: hypothetical protein VHG71_12675 [Verrucomicrobiae bacterium]|nr:hypothetical protein [Verrucomicrobiae bacterium]
MNRLKISTALVMLLALVFLGIIVFPVLWDEWLARKWEQQIRQKQNPEELRTWAKELFALYSTNQFELQMQITNTPPKGIPVSKYGPTILLEKDNTDSGPSEHLFLIWKFIRARGLYVGETNYVSSNGKMWKPGIYFYTEP